ncbi:GDYXXLXY domain-containing protein [Shewanella sp. TC10]|uniref:GDYXXLXY domain-containing protein n=1 Tax=Shewanella sp. TC10 TaxID=1419739 RepID=UPI001E32E740|nr:GDYXXLXY domain-containing protein [Shewanella sp. TC10]
MADRVAMSMTMMFSVFIAFLPVDYYPLTYGRAICYRNRHGGFTFTALLALPIKLLNRDGYVVVSFDSRNIATYKALYDGQELAADEMRLQYRVRDGRIKFAVNAFFFQEGHASVYEAAKYGEFRVNQQGEVLLTNIFDAELNKLEPQIAAEE